MKHLFIAAQRQIPRIMIESRQGEILQTKKIIVSIDSWPRTSRYPLVCSDSLRNFILLKIYDVILGDREARVKNSCWSYFKDLIVLESMLFTKCLYSVLFRTFYYRVFDFSMVILGTVQKLHNNQRGRGSTILLHVVTYVMYFWKSYVKSEFVNSKSSI